MKGLFIKFINRECTEKEVQQIIEYFKNSKDLADVPTIEAVSNLLDTYPTMEEDDANRIYKNIHVTTKQLENKPVNKNNYWKFTAAAASIIILFSFNFIFNNNSDKNSVPISVESDKVPILIGTDKATLTLEDGSNITLEKGDEFVTDKLNSDGENIVYTKSTNSKSELVYNYLTIPRGGQYSLKLSDGTEVWLNSESQLKYPVSFIAGETRQVELVYGEAYFDVSPSTEHNGAKFKVVNQAQEVEVLGTEFNIKAYKDEDYIFTTLVEGKVAVSNSLTKQNLVPNQQSIINLKNKNITINAVDVYSETSWKNGLFSFKHKPLSEIMLVLSRWYDVDVKFTNAEVEKLKFNGVLSKNDKIEEVLEIIKNAKFINNYEINDKKITIN